MKNVSPKFIFDPIERLKRRKFYIPKKPQNFFQINKILKDILGKIKKLTPKNS